MTETRRKFSREFKLAAVKELESGKSLNRLSRELEVDRKVLRNWREELQRDPLKAFPGVGKQGGSDREAQLERKIGQMTMEIEFLKKALQRVEEQRLLENVGGGKRSTKRSRKM